MPSINLIRASDGTGDATVATFTAPRTPSSTTCQVDSIAGWPQEFIATCGTPNVDTGIIESNIQVFVGHLSGSDIVIDAFAPGYSDMGNQVGDIIVIKPTTRTQDEIADILNVSHDDDGTLKANSVGTAQIVDQAVSAAKIADGAITTNALAQGAVTAPKIDFTTFPFEITGIYPDFSGASGVPGTAGNSYVQTNKSLPRARSAGESIFIVPTNLQWCTVSGISASTSTFGFTMNCTNTTGGMSARFAAIYYKVN